MSSLFSSLKNLIKDLNFMLIIELLMFLSFLIETHDF